MFSKIKTYGLIALTAIIAVLYGLLSASKNKLARRDKEDAEAQRDTLVRAQENMSKAAQQGRRKEDEAVKNADSGDWSGFNDGV